MSPKLIKNNTIEKYLRCMQHLGTIPQLHALHKATKKSCSSLLSIFYNANTRMNNIGKQVKKVLRLKVPVIL